jgi:hypothetical protein
MLFLSKTSLFRLGTSRHARYLFEQSVFNSKLIHLEEPSRRFSSEQMKKNWAAVVGQIPNTTLLITQRPQPDVSSPKIDALISSLENDSESV